VRHNVRITGVCAKYVLSAISEPHQIAASASRAEALAAVAIGCSAFVVQRTDLLNYVINSQLKLAGFSSEDESDSRPVIAAQLIVLCGVRNDRNTPSTR
jgi:hypothetical protein